MQNYREISNARKTYTKHSSRYFSRANLIYSSLQMNLRRIFGMCFWHEFFLFSICLQRLPTKFSCSTFLLIDSIVHLPRVVISLLYGHHNIVMMRQVPLQTNILRVLVRTQVARESSLTATFEAHVSCQVVL